MKIQQCRRFPKTTQITTSTRYAMADARGPLEDSLWLDLLAGRLRARTGIHEHSSENLRVANDLYIAYSFERESSRVRSGRVIRLLLFAFYNPVDPLPYTQFNPILGILSKGSSKRWDGADERIHPTPTPPIGATIKKPY